MTIMPHDDSHRHHRQNLMSNELIRKGKELCLSVKFVYR